MSAMNTSAPPIELTPPQQHFADKRHATPGPHCGNDAICLYHEDPDVTWRWIVRSDGRVLETIAFLK